jgi:hypothetical protein
MMNKPQKQNLLLNPPDAPQDQPWRGPNVGENDDFLIELPWKIDPKYSFIFVQFFWQKIPPNESKKLKWWKQLWLIDFWNLISVSLLVLSVGWLVGWIGQSGNKFFLPSCGIWEVGIFFPLLFANFWFVCWKILLKINHQTFPSVCPVVALLFPCVWYNYFDAFQSEIFFERLLINQTQSFDHNHPFAAIFQENDFVYVVGVGKY